MKKALLLSFLITTSFLFGQTILQPVHEITYGNRLHTNRDYLEKTLKDNDDNIYLVGTTENDFTFNDIKIIKLNNDLGVLWQTEKSFNIGISYEAILGAHIDANNNLIVICRAAYTSFNQTFVVLKYSPTGDLLWQYSVADLSNPIDHDRYSYYSYIDTSNNLNLVYRPRNQTVFEYFFLSISPTGQKIDEYSKINQFSASDGLLNPYKLINFDDVYYMVMLDGLDSEPWQKFTFHKFDKNSNVSLELTLDDVAANYFAQSFAETWSMLKKDRADKLILITPDYSLRKDYGLLSLNLDGSINYTKFPDDVNDRYLLESGFDNANNLLVISNNRKSSTSDNLQISLQKYDQDGALIQQVSASHIGEFVTISNSKISVLTTENKIVSFDFNFNLIDEIQLNTVSTSSFGINDLLTAGSNYFLSGNTQDINYASSVLISEIDMLIKKSNQTTELATYRFTGAGTSKVFKRNELVVRDTAYAFAVTEKIGPDNFSPNGSIAPEQQRFVTLKKDDLSILEDKVVPLNNILLTTQYPKKLITSYTDTNGDLYEYIISADTTNVSLRKNYAIEWVRNLELYKDPNGDPFMSDDEVIFDWKVNYKGDFILTTYIYGLSKCTLHKFSLNNEYNSVEFDELIVTTLPLANHWIFTMSRSGNVIIYSDRLTVINQLQSPFNNVSEFSFYAKEKNNQIQFHKYQEQIVWRFNQFGEIQNDYFEIDTPVDLSSNSSTEYDNNFLLVLEQFGSSIYLEPQYSWNRAILKKYDLDQTSTFDEISFDDDDNDGVDNSIDECRNTSSNESVNEFGCSESQTLSTEQSDLVNDLKIYPNPTKGFLNFELTNSFRIESVELNDVIGRPVITLDATSFRDGKIDISSLSKGVYIIRFIFDDGNSISKQVILEGF